jgi:hypothetical protein
MKLCDSESNLMSSRYCVKVSLERRSMRSCQAKSRWIFWTVARTRPKQHVASQLQPSLNPIPRLQRPLKTVCKINSILDAFSVKSTIPKPSPEPGIHSLPVLVWQHVSSHEGSNNHPPTSYSSQRARRATQTLPTCLIFVVVLSIEFSSSRKGSQTPLNANPNLPQDPDPFLGLHSHPHILLPLHSNTTDLPRCYRSSLCYSLLPSPNS